MRRRAFTLMEVILAIGILVALSGGLFGFMWNTLSRRDELVAGAARAQAAGAMLDRLEADIAGTIAGVEGLGAGVSGTPTSVRLLTRGVTIPVGEAERPTALRDLQGAEYQFHAASRVVRARRWDATGSVGEFEPACPGVGRVRLRYYDGRRWRSSFDSLSAKALPVAIEVALWFGEAAPPMPESGDVAEPAPEPEPDRVRVIIVPDGPVTTWREAR